MTEENIIKKWRPHHIMCSPMLHTQGRGDDFYRVKDTIIETMNSGSEAIIIQPTEGPDELCIPCPLYENGRCGSTEGNEEAVRKWDGILLRELGLSYGDQLTARDYAALIRSKVPLPFCSNRCRKKDVCDLFKDIK